MFKLTYLLLLFPFAPFPLIVAVAAILPTVRFGVDASGWFRRFFLGDWSITQSRAWYEATLAEVQLDDRFILTMKEQNTCFAAGCPVAAIIIHLFFPSGFLLIGFAQFLRYAQMSVTSGADISFSFTYGFVLLPTRIRLQMIKTYFLSVCFIGVLPPRHFAVQLTNLMCVKASKSATIFY